MKHFNIHNKKNLTLIQQLVLSLIKYMIKQDFVIQPLPKIVLINRDYENANNFFGKTASYNNNKKIITIYTLGRHPKDILRSFAHEMVHHEQCLLGKTNKKNYGTNINEDDWLLEREKEAYLKGNIVFRSWADNLKDKIKFNFINHG